jgi:hypothetical protein
MHSGISTCVDYIRGAPRGRDGLRAVDDARCRAVRVIDAATTIRLEFARGSHTRRGSTAWGIG